jgi:hypothetical protein
MLAPGRRRSARLTRSLHARASRAYQVHIIELRVLFAFADAD